MPDNAAIDDYLELLDAEKKAALANPALYWFREAPRDPQTGEKLWPCANPVQMEFSKSLAKSKWLLGGNQSGKTEGVVRLLCGIMAFVKCIVDIYGVPKRQLMIRYYALTLQKIEEIILPKLRAALPAGLVNTKRGRGGYHSDTHIFFVRNPYGADHEIHFATYDQDLSMAEGGQYDVVAYDEPPPEPIRKANLLRCMRKGGLALEVGALTPLSLELSWDIAWIHNEIVSKADGKNIAVWWMSTDINRENLNPEAFDRMFAQMSLQDQQVRRHGQFAFLAGLVYRDPRFGPEHICKGFDVRARIRKRGSKAGQVWRGLDHGVGNPTAVSWWYVEGPAEEARGWKFQEYLAEGNSVETNCAAILELDAGLPDGPWVADASIWNCDPVTGMPLANEYHRCGVPIIEGESSSGSVERGHEVIQSLMRIPRNAKGESWLMCPSVGTPRFMVFEDCVETIKAYRNYIRQPASSRRSGDQRGKVKPAERWKHIPDTDRYVWTYGPSGEADKAPPMPDCDPVTGNPYRIAVLSAPALAEASADLALGEVA